MVRERWVLLALLLLPWAARADEDLDVEAARRHFVKAKAHAAKGDYETALREFLVTRSIKALPDLDYDVARCHDALEHYPEAIAEYEKYLSHNPSDAATVRARIAVLRDRISAIEHINGRGETKPPVEPAKPVVEAAKPVVEAAKPVVEPAKPVEPPPSTAPPVVENAAPAATTVTATPPARKTPIYKRWWLWTAVGAAAVVVVVGVGLGVGLSSSPPGFQSSLAPFGPGAK